MNYSEAVDLLLASPGGKSRSDLSEIHHLLDSLGNPEKGLRYIHVAGTNGKGSTSAMLASVLHFAGYRTGLFTSPHLILINERIRVDGQAIPDKDFAELTERVNAVSADAIHEGKQDYSFFEKITAIALLWFQRQQCDYVVLEVGMGGRLDATNAIPDEDVVLSVLTHIGLDHTQYLGDTVAKIAAEKAGILRPGGYAVYDAQSAEAENVFRQFISDKKVHAFRSCHENARIRQMSLEGTVFDFEGSQAIYLPLIGEYQVRNACLVLKAIDVLRKRGVAISGNAQRLGLASVCWPGRMHLLRKDPPVFVDGAHNPQGIQMLLRSLERLLPGEKITFVLGVLREKDVSTELQMLLPVASRFLTVTPPTPRAMGGEELAEMLRREGADAVAYRSVGEALDAIQNESRAVCIAGSLYQVGDVLTYFGQSV